MKKATTLFLMLAGILLFAACNDTETYAEQKERERAAINAYIQKNGIKVISEAQFKQQNQTTNVNNKEFVLFENTGVYMQIERQGCGEKIKPGETVTVLCRFNEYNLMTDSLQLTNNVLLWSAMVDKMSVTNSSGTFTAYFDSGSSVMSVAYGTSVPAGWLIPLSYINVGRPSTAEEQVAKVRLIVPHTQGQSYASQSVYPCLYEITYERGR